MRLRGATTVTSDQEQAEATLTRKITVGMRAIANVLLSASTAGIVNVLSTSAPIGN